MTGVTETDVHVREPLLLSIVLIEVGTVPTPERLRQAFRDSYNGTIEPTRVMIRQDE